MRILVLKVPMIEELQKDNKILKNKIMWVLKNSDEYAVYGKTKKEAIINFKEKLGLIVSPKMIKRL